jgi:uncharacterized protein YcbX
LRRALVVSRSYPSPVSTGVVLELHRWPVKSMAGQPVGALAVDGRGAGGDRTHAVFDRFKEAPRRLTARQSPRLLAWSASYDGAEIDPADPPLPLLTAPDGERYGWDDPRLPGALAADLGREVTLQRDPAGQQDLGRSVLITTRATLEAVQRELGRPLDLRRFRTNVHVELDAPAYAEEGWEGRRLHIGDAELELLHPCERCVIPTRDPDNQEKWAGLLRWLAREHGCLFGINARPIGPARIAAGDRVELV